MSPKLKNAIILTGFIIGAIIVLYIFGVISYIYFFTDKVINIDIVTILSIVLALFSIFLSMMFYFKANETSNKFYDNSFNFMKDQSVILGRIEERFGAQLDIIDDKVSGLSGISNRRIEKEQELEKAKNSLQEIVEKLYADSDMQAYKKTELKEELKLKEAETLLLKNEIIKLDRMLNNNLQELDKKKKGRGN